jgi:E3 ubiquitin-protein ligase HUWE1
MLDAYFTRSFYKHILGLEITYDDMEDQDYQFYKNMKWMVENDMTDIDDFTFR